MPASEGPRQLLKGVEVWLAVCTRRPRREPHIHTNAAPCDANSYAAGDIRTLIAEERNEPPRSPRRLACLVAGEGFEPPTSGL